MTSSEGEEFLDSADVNEEFEFEDEASELNSENEFEYEEDGHHSEDDEMQMEQQKYAEELEYEDVGEPATFNFNIHNGKSARFNFWFFI